MGETRSTVRVGAIDIGSNSIRLLVADVSADGGAGELTVVVRAGEPCRLGRGLDSTGLIGEAVAVRAATLAVEFVRRARSLGVGPLLVGATAALRDASNGAEIATRIAERCGVPVRILSGDEEARLVYESVVLGLGAPGRRSPCVVFDLGGRSTEVVSGMGERAGRWTSLPFGAVSLTERFLHSGLARDEEAHALESHVESGIRERCAGMPAVAPVLAGVGGTVTAFGVLDRELATYDPTLVEGWVVGLDRLEALVERFLGSTEAERRTWTGLGTGRADIVVAGALVVRLLARRFQARGLVCSTQGLRYGLARLAASEGQPG